MLQMASLNHTGYKPENGVKLALPEVPNRKKKSGSRTKSGRKKESDSSSRSKNKKIVTQRIRFVPRVGSRNKSSVPAEDVWVQLVQEGSRM